VASDGVGVAAPADTVAVAAPRQVLTPDRGLWGWDQLLEPGGMSPGQGLVYVFQGYMPERAGSLDKNRVCVLQAGAFESGLVSVP
jgi:hypothetical protein